MGKTSKENKHMFNWWKHKIGNTSKHMFNWHKYKTSNGSKHMFNSCKHNCNEIYMIFYTWINSFKCKAFTYQIVMYSNNKLYAGSAPAMSFITGNSRIYFC